MTRFNTSRRLLTTTLTALAALAALAMAASLPALAQNAKKDLSIGATAGANADVLRLGIVPQLEHKGYKVRIVEFNDYVQPNLALANGSLDLNFFQHIVYLKKFTSDQKLDLVDVVQGPIAPMGVYSQKRKSLAEAKKGDRVTLPNDPANLARALVLLQQHQLITLRADADALRVSEKDITTNPLALKFQPLEAAQLPRSLGDAEYAIVPGNFAISSGLKLTEALTLEKTPDHYLLVLAARRADKDAPWVKDVAETFRTKDFKAALDQHFPGYARPSFLR